MREKPSDYAGLSGPGMPVLTILVGRGFFRSAFSMLSRPFDFAHSSGEQWSESKGALPIGGRRGLGGNQSASSELEIKRRRWRRKSWPQLRVKFKGARTELARNKLLDKAFKISPSAVLV